MATKKTSRTTGITKDAYAVAKMFKKGEEFSAENFAIPEATPKQVGSALAYLRSRGLLEHGKLKGFYRLPSSSVNPAQAIYDLLDFMAKAEAPLRRAAKILEAVEGA